MNDIRWHQRLNSFEKAFQNLAAAVKTSKERPLNDLEKQGLIQAFEVTHEAAWLTLKDYFEHQGNTDITGSRDATREAFSMKLIEDGENWMEMIKSRNQTSHTYNKTTADDISNRIISDYNLLFSGLLDKLKELKK